jgi:hypothetical protein
MPQVKVLAGLIIVAAAAVIAAADSMQLASQLERDPWGVASASQRFAGAAARLPVGGAVGYISDLPVQDQNGTAAFLAAQYALAPRLLTPADPQGPQIAVGNFSQPANYAAAGAQSGYTVEADLGNGVVLYRKAK